MDWVSKGKDIELREWDWEIKRDKWIFKEETIWCGRSLDNVRDRMNE